MSGSKTFRRGVQWAGPVVILGALALTQSANALPSFARQTGAACEQCHTVSFGPALTPYGRQFKLNGYTWSSGSPGLPLALMVEGGYTRTAKDQPDPPAEHVGTNDNLTVDQVSLFYGGKLGEHAGLFAQVTYSGIERNVSWDNLDLRYARTVSFGQQHYAVLGVSLNNNPTAQDLWNTTPAWGFPYISSELAPTPSAAPVLSALGGTVLGANVYGMVDGTLYLEAGAYKSLADRWLEHVGLTDDDNSHLSGMAPYLRVGVDRENGAHHWHLGGVLLDATVRPDPSQPATDRYRDVGIDGMYQYFNGGDHSLTINGIVIRESRNLSSSVLLGAAENSTGHLVTTSTEFTYAYKSTYAASVSMFDIHGNNDGGLYPAESLSGSATGRPDSRGYTLQAEYIPFGKASSPGRNWLNVRLGLQYTAYSLFNGGSTDYDGNGRNASDNNTLFAYAWFLF